MMRGEKTMKKQIISAAVAAALFFAAVPCTFAQEGEVEIAFKVGDSVLSINGTPTVVETPYVAGDGTTLVPLRVITEAFGAQLDWEGETQTITLTYPDVSIVLQIGNSIAQVNDHAETLLEPPALSANGVTMVPLRFISETFGADVGYDNDIQAITVTKKAIKASAVVTGSTDLPRTGDSYYKWSIDTPKQLTMSERSDDGISTAFTSDDGNMYIDIYRIDDDTESFDEAFSKAKDSMSSYTLIEAEKLRDENGHQYFHVQAKDKYRFIDICEYYTDNYIFDVYINIDAGAEEDTKAMMLALSESFKIGAVGNDTYDLSTVIEVDGEQYRTISDENYGVSFDVPANYEVSSSGTENEFRIYDTDEDLKAYIALGIYSKTADLTAQSLAEKDRTANEKKMNPALTTVSEISGTSELQYTITVSGSKYSDTYIVDTFFEKGDYVYNFAVAAKGSAPTKQTEHILSSLTTEQLDSAKVGKLMRNDPEGIDMTVKTSSYQFVLPDSWKEISNYSDSYAAINSSTASMITVESDKGSEIKKSSLTDLASSFKDRITSDSDTVIEENIKYETINGTRYAHFTAKSDSGKNVSYATCYIACYDGRADLFVLMQDEASYNSEEINTFMKLIETFKEI